MEDILKFMSRRLIIKKIDHKSKSLRQKKSRPLKEINFNRIQMQNSANVMCNVIKCNVISNVMCNQSS